MGLALPCLLRIVAARPPSRLMRVCVTHIKTFPGRGRSPSSNRLDRIRVPVITSGTPQANAPRRCVGVDRTPPRAKGARCRPDSPASQRGAAPPGLCSLRRPTPGARNERREKAAQCGGKGRCASYVRKAPEARRTTERAGQQSAIGPLRAGRPAAARSQGVARHRTKNPGERRRTREPRCVRTSARLRTPRRCSPECARAH